MQDIIYIGGTAAVFVLFTVFIALCKKLEGGAHGN
jgi:hypothetical protein